MINVLTEALEMEMRHLGDGNLTWRFHRRHPEFIHPIQGYLSPSVRPILKDFIQNNDDAKAKLNEHDRLLEVAIRDAGAAFDTLMANQAFLAQAQRRITEFGREIWGAEKSLAEYVINRLESLPTNWDAVDFWEKHHAEFLALGHGAQFTTLDESKASLRDHDQTVLEFLEANAAELCAAHDLPAAPSGSAPLP